MQCSETVNLRSRCLGVFARFGWVWPRLDRAKPLPRWRRARPRAMARAEPEPGWFATNPNQPPPAPTNRHQPQPTNPTTPFNPSQPYLCSRGHQQPADQRKTDTRTSATNHPTIRPGPGPGQTPVRHGTQLHMMASGPQNSKTVTRCLWPPSWAPGHSLPDKHVPPYMCNCERCLRGRVGPRTELAEVLTQRSRTYRSGGPGTYRRPIRLRSQ